MRQPTPEQLKRLKPFHKKHIDALRKEEDAKRDFIRAIDDIRMENEVPISATFEPNTNLFCTDTPQGLVPLKGDPAPPKIPEAQS